MIELDEDVRERIAMDAARDVQCGGPSVALARRTIDAVLSHLNTPEAPDAYEWLGKELLEIYEETVPGKEAQAFADYLRKRDERLRAALVKTYGPEAFAIQCFDDALKAEMRS